VGMDADFFLTLYLADMAKNFLNNNSIERGVVILGKC
jgi:hypothetical protein